MSWFWFRVLYRSYKQYLQAVLIFLISKMTSGLLTRCRSRCRICKHVQFWQNVCGYQTFSLIMIYPLFYELAVVRECLACATPLSIHSLRNMGQRSSKGILLCEDSIFFHHKSAQDEGLMQSEYNSFNSIYLCTQSDFTLDTSGFITFFLICERENNFSSRIMIWRSPDHFKKNLSQISIKN